MSDFYIQPQDLKSCYKNSPFQFTIAGPLQVYVFKPLKKLSFWFWKFLIVPKKITQASLCSSEFSQHVLSKYLWVVDSKQTGTLVDILIYNTKKIETHRLLMIFNTCLDVSLSRLSPQISKSVLILVMEKSNTYDEIVKTSLLD